MFPLIAALVLGSAPGFAQTDEERAGARSLAEQGFAAYKAGKWQDALDRFERAESLMHAPPHLLYAARASAKLGGFVKARELYNKILREELAASAPPAFRQAKKDAAAELPAVEKKIAYLTVTVSGPKPGEAEVKLDGVVVPRALVGVERPVDPGTRKVSVSAPGFTAVERDITLDDAARESMSIELVADPSAPAGSDTTTPGAEQEPGGDSTTPGADAGTDSGGMSGMRIGAFISLGVGVVGLGLGTVFLIGAGSTQSDSDALFEDPANGCSAATPLVPAKCAESDSLNEDAAGKRTLSAVSFAVGGVGVVAGVLLFVLSSDSKAEAKAPAGPHVTPWVGYNSLGVSGAF